MSGSYQHILDDDGNLIDNVTFIDMIEHLGDAYEMAEDMHQIIERLEAELVDLRRELGRLHQIIERRDNRMSDEMVKLYPEPPRPRMCPEQTCRPLIQLPGYTIEQRESGVREWEPGESWFCWGVMAETVTFTYADVEHPNDLRSCVFTPLKGLISFQENRDDWWTLARKFESALKQLNAYRAALDGEET